MRAAKFKRIITIVYVFIILVALSFAYYRTTFFVF